MADKIISDQTDKSFGAWSLVLPSLFFLMHL